MKLLKYTLIALLLASTGMVAHAQEAKIIPEKGRSALGGLGGLSAFNAHIALGRLAKADVSTKEKLKHAAGQTGGIGGGMGAAIGMLEGCMELIPEGELPALKGIIDMNKLVAEQAKALVNVLKAGESGVGLDEAKKAFAEARAKSADSLAKQMGIPKEVLK